MDDADVGQAGLGMCINHMSIVAMAGLGRAGFRIGGRDVCKSRPHACDARSASYVRTYIHASMQSPSLRAEREGEGFKKLEPELTPKTKVPGSLVEDLPRM